MGTAVEFPSNGGVDQGWLALPEGGKGPGVIVIQEWWGLVDHIKDVCERLARAGFVALAPDLYHGKAIGNREPDEAQKAMMALNIQQATKDMSGAVDFLRRQAAVTGDGLAVVGFCMGGGLALLLALQRPEAVRAVVPFYGGVPQHNGAPDWSKLNAAVQGHYAEHDDMAGPPVAHRLEADIKQAGKHVEMYIYPATHHAFFNDTRPEVYNAEAANLAWERTLSFLHGVIG